MKTMIVNWKGDMAFEADPESGQKFVMDAYPESGGHNLGPTPFELFEASIGTCSAMDVISILKKKQQKITSYRIEIEGERTPEGVYPRPFTSLKVTHYFAGENLDPEAVKRAVALSDEKYCSVIATLREGPEVTSEWVIE